MRKAIDLSIDKACQENWNSFDKNERGGFCGRCRKNVIDFTCKSDSAIHDFFLKNPVGVCGRFRPDQLKVYKIGKERIGFSKAAIITAGMLTLSQVNESHAREIATNASVERAISTNDLDTTVGGLSGSADTSLYTITGHVRSIDDKSDVPGVNVVIKGTAIQTVTGVNGEFQLSYPGDDPELVLVFSFIGYATVEKKIELKENIINVGTIDLETDVVVLGEVCTYRKWSPRGIWRRIRGIFY